MREDSVVYKYPLDNIWRVVEEYVPTPREPKGKAA
jgi:hypothetical protein